MPQTLGVTRLAAAGALAVFLVGLGYAIVSGLGDDDGAPTVVAPAPVTTSTTTKSAAGRPKAAPFVKLSAAGAFDPEGDGSERDEEAQLAVDGRQETFWRTERYARFFKSGVGLVLDAGRRIRVEQVVVDTPAPGIQAEIRLGAARQGPFVKVSPARRLTARTRFPVARRPGRYVVVWITELPPESAGEISEVRVRARG
jgi:hypothetical protein